MAIDSRLQSTERRGTGAWPFWLILFVAGCAGMCAGIVLSPGTGGFLLLLASGILAGVSYGALMAYLPSLTSRVWTSLLVAALVLLLLVGLAFATSRAAPMPSGSSDLFLTPQ